MFSTRRRDVPIQDQINRLKDLNKTLGQQLRILRSELRRCKLDVAVERRKNRQHEEQLNEIMDQWKETIETSRKLREKLKECRSKLQSMPPRKRRKKN